MQLVDGGLPERSERVGVPESTDEDVRRVFDASTISTGSRRTDGGVEDGDDRTVRTCLFRSPRACHSPCAQTRVPPASRQQRRRRAWHASCKLCRECRSGPYAGLRRLTPDLVRTRSPDGMSGCTGGERQLRAIGWQEELGAAGAWPIRSWAARGCGWGVQSEERVTHLQARSRSAVPRCDCQ